MDIETRRKKQQALIQRMVERKVRSRAQQLYESRGEEAGGDLQDWFQAESEVVESAGIAALYKRRKEAREQISNPTEEPACEARS